MSADPARELAAALDRVNFVNFAGVARAESRASRPWAGIGISGVRHRLVMHLEGRGARGAAAAFIAGLDRHEFVLPGHIVADIHCGECEHWDHKARLTLEALTVEAD